MSVPADAHLDVVALGTRVRIDLARAPEGARERLEQLWGRCLPGTGVGASTVVPTNAGATDASGAGPVVVGGDTWDDLESGYTRLTQDVTHAAIDALAGRALMLHAGAVCHPETGAAMVWVAPGGTGKTTLTARSARRWAYLTDETVAVRDAGPGGVRGGDEILPYPKPLSRRLVGHATKVEASPDELGLLPCSVRPWVAGIGVLERRAEYARPSVERMDLADALVRVAPESSSLALIDRPLQRLAALVERAGGLRLLRYSEAEQLDDLVDEVVSRPIPPGPATSDERGS